MKIDTIKFIIIESWKVWEIVTVNKLIKYVELLKYDIQHKRDR